MKRGFWWLFAAALFVFVIDWGVAGVKLFNGDYDITVEAYVAMVCFAALLVCSVARILSSRCPHCRKLRLTGGEYCSYCGRKIG